MVSPDLNWYSSPYLVLHQSTEMRTGDVMIRWTEQGQDLVKIVRIQKTVEISSWSPLTSTGTLLVNNILVSCYSGYPHWAADILYSPVKVWPTLLLDDDKSQHNDGARWVAKVIKWLGDALQFGYGAVDHRNEENTRKNVIKDTELLSTMVNSEL